MTADERGGRRSGKLTISNLLLVLHLTSVELSDPFRFWRAISHECSFERACYEAAFHTETCERLLFS